MLIYYRLDGNNVKSLDDSIWINLKPFYNQDYEYLNYLTSTLRGLNLLYLELVNMWMKLTTKTTLPDELKIMFAEA